MDVFVDWKVGNFNVDVEYELHKSLCNVQLYELLKKRLRQPWTSGRTNVLGIASPTLPQSLTFHSQATRMFLKTPFPDGMKLYFQITHSVYVYSSSFFFRILWERQIAGEAVQAYMKNWLNIFPIDGFQHQTFYELERDFVSFGVFIFKNKNRDCFSLKSNWNCETICNTTEGTRFLWHKISRRKILRVGFNVISQKF